MNCSTLVPTAYMMMPVDCASADGGAGALRTGTWPAASARPNRCRPLPFVACTQASTASATGPRCRSPRRPPRTSRPNRRDQTIDGTSAPGTERWRSTPRTPRHRGHRHDDDARQRQPARSRPLRRPCRAAAQGRPSASCCPKPGRRPRTSGEARCYPTQDERSVRRPRHERQHQVPRCLPARRTPSTPG